MPVCSCSIDLFGKIDGCNRIFWGGGGRWQRSLYEVRTTHVDDGEYDGGECVCVVCLC